MTDYTQQEKARRAAVRAREQRAREDDLEQALAKAKADLLRVTLQRDEALLVLQDLERERGRTAAETDRVINLLQQRWLTCIPQVLQHAVAGDQVRIDFDATYASTLLRFDTSDSEVTLLALVPSSSRAVKDPSFFMTLAPAAREKL